MAQEKDILLIGSIGVGYCEDNVIESDNHTFNGAIAYLVTYLSKHGYKVDYVDCIEIEYQNIINKLKENTYKLIGISTTLCNNMQSVIKLVVNMKELTDTKIVLGGVYIAKLLTLMKKENPIILQKTLNKMNADYYIDSYEGESSLSQLLHARKLGLPVESVPNLYYKEDGNYVNTFSEIENNNLEQNVVDWSLMKAEDCRGKILPVRTSQSCLFNCLFCTYKIFAGDYRCISIEAIEMELNSIAKLGSNNPINFVDDTFNVPINRFKEILKMMVRNQYHFRWSSYIRSQYLDEEITDLMKRSGCYQVFIGIESGSQVMLDSMNKQVKTDKLKAGIQLLKKHGIQSHGFFFIGFPGETKETVQDTIRFINESGLDTYSITPWINDTMAPIYEKRKALNIKGVGQNWSHNTMDSKEAGYYVEEVVKATEVYGFRTRIQ